MRKYFKYENNQFLKIWICRINVHEQSLSLLTQSWSGYFYTNSIEWYTVSFAVDISHIIAILISSQHMMNYCRTIIRNNIPVDLSVRSNFIFSLQKTTVQNTYEKFNGIRTLIFVIRILWCIIRMIMG